MTLQARRKGREAKFVRDQFGKEVHGLSANKRTNKKTGDGYHVYYATYSKPRKWLGRDLTEAIRRFRNWQSEQQGRQVSIVEERPPTLSERERIERGNELFGEDWGQPDTVIAQTKVGEAAFWERVRDAIIHDPEEAAEKTGIKQLSYLTDLKPPTPSLPLMTSDAQWKAGKISVGQFYFNKPEKISWQAKRDARMYWKEFCSIVPAKTVAQLTAEHLRTYRDTILKKGKSHAPTWARHRFSSVKTILGYALKQGEDLANLRYALDLCQMLIPPKKNGSNPKPISVKHFRAIMRATNEKKFSAMWLCMLNFAMKPSEVIQIKRSDIDLGKGVLIMERPKSGVLRVGVLWKRTREAIRTYLKEQPHDDGILFVNEDGRPWSEIRGGRSISEHFRKFRKKAKVPTLVKAEHIRDGAYTAAVEQGGEDWVHAKIVAGHSVGMPDDYVRRNPKMVADACAAIEKHYFGKTR